MTVNELKQRRGYANLTNDYMFKRVFGSEEYFLDRELFYASYPIMNQAALAKEEFRKTRGDAGVFRWSFRLKPVRW